MVRGDDFAMVADIEDLRCLESMLQEKFDDRHHWTRGGDQEANQGSEQIHLSWMTDIRR